MSGEADGSPSSALGSLDSPVTWRCCMEGGLRTPPSLSLPPLPQSVGRPVSTQTLALSASSPRACPASGPTHGVCVGEAKWALS